MAESVRSSRWWKWVAIVSLLMVACSLATLVIVLLIPVRLTRLTDDRLIGTWQSDADQTIAGIRGRKSLNDKQEAALRKLFGKLRVTYTRTDYTTELDGSTKTYRYVVLGKDKISVVLREIKDKPSPLDEMMDLSEFTVIQFDGPDSYWLTTQIGGIREYFKRVE